MPFTNAGAGRCFRGGLVTSDQFAGLHTATPPTGANEFSASGYDALEVEPADWSIAGEMASLNKTLEWASAAAAEWGDPMHVGFWGNQTNRGASDLLAFMAVAQDVPNVTLGTRVFVQSGDLVHRIPLVGITAAGALRCFSGGLISTAMFLGLHTGTPTSANELSGTGYAALEVVDAEWNVNDNVASLNVAQEWTGAAEAVWGDPVIVGFWNHATQRQTANLLGSMMLSQNVDEIRVGARVYAEPNDIRIRIPLS